MLQALSLDRTVQVRRWLLQALSLDRNRTARQDPQCTPIRVVQARLSQISLLTMFISFWVFRRPR